MNNKNDMKTQFERMRNLMNYGLNESKKQSYTGVEFSKEGADGKLYGIIREGSKFYIKVCNNKKNSMLAESFDYINGFRNRKDNEYTSFANAQKNFDLKMMSLAEAYGNGKNIVVESWNPDKLEENSVESTNKMRKEIMRERQIMENASSIYNRKPQTALKPINEGDDCNKNFPFTDKADKEYQVTDTIKGGPEKGGDAKKVNKDYKNANLKDTEIKEGKSCSACGKNPCVCGDKDKVNEESEQVLGWNRNDDYMDTTHGTEIGSSMPFDDSKGKDITDKEGTSKTDALKQGTVEEGVSMHDSDNQNTPKPGVGKIGSNEPFDAEKGRQIDEAIDDIEGDASLEDGDDLGLEDDSLDNEEGFDADLDANTDADYELDLEDNSLEDRMDAIEDKLDQLLNAVAEEDYEDDDLYDDEDDEDAEYEIESSDEGFDDADGLGDDEDLDYDGDEDFEDEGPIEDETVYESRAYRAMKLRENIRRRKALNEDGMRPFKDSGRVPQGNMNKLDNFGDHPAYQKKVMSLPPKDLQEFPDYYDMNDDSVRSDAPYGEKIGDGSPFNIDPDSVDNAIAESINRVLKKNR